MSLTLTDAQELVDDAKVAYKLALKTLNYAISTGGTNRSLARQDVEKLRQHFLFWCGEVDRLSATPIGKKVRIGRVLPQRGHLRSI